MLFILSFVLGEIGNAQCKLAEAIKVQLITDWKLAKEFTNEYLNTMPADRYNFKPHDSVRNFAEQMLHLAQVTSAMISHGTGAQRLFERGRALERSATAQTKDSVLYYINASYDYVINAIQDMDASKLEETVKERNMEETRFSWLLKAFAHQTHHRGQTSIYLRMVGLRPPVYME